MIDRSFHVRRAGCRGTSDEAVWVINEEFDPRRRQPDVGRAWLRRSAWHGLVHEEWGAVQMKASYTAQVPEHGRA